MSLAIPQATRDLQSAGDELPLAALWTPQGRGAVATIRLRADVRRGPAPAALPFQAANGKALSVQPHGRVIFGRWGGGRGKRFRGRRRRLRRR